MIKDKKIAFFGCKNITKTCIQNFIRDVGPVDYLITISPENGEKNLVAGYMDLKSFAEQNQIKIYTAEKYTLNSEKDKKEIKQMEIDIAFVIGWQRLIPADILKEIKTGIFGMHGSSEDLPKGRGRSPMNWALILDKKQFYTNLFKYEDNIDGGDILDTQKFDINNFDTIETLHFKNMISMSRLIKKNINKLLENKFELKKQQHENATYYPKRTSEDGWIDWTLKTRDIYNLCRAVTKPFPGAISEIDGIEIKIWKTQTFTESWKYEKAKPGEIVEKFYNNKFVVKTKDGCILITDYEINNEGKIRKGVILKSKNYEEIYKEIETRYPYFIKNSEKEITFEKIKKFYNK